MSYKIYIKAHRLDGRIIKWLVIFRLDSSYHTYWLFDQYSIAKKLYKNLKDAINRYGIYRPVGEYHSFYENLVSTGKL